MDLRHIDTNVMSLSYQMIKCFIHNNDMIHQETEEVFLNNDWLASTSIAKKMCGSNHMMKHKHTNEVMVKL